MYGGIGYAGDGSYGMDDGSIQMANAHVGNLGFGAGLGMSIGMGMTPNTFLFMGNALSLQTRIESLKDEEIEKIADISISVSGTQVQSMNMASYLCTIIWGSIIIFPLFFLCMGWWKRCTYPAFTIDSQIYQSLSRLTKSSSLKNITLRVMDNAFDREKANILYNCIM